MSFISTWLNEQSQAKEAAIMVEDTLVQLKIRQKVLDQFMPPKIYDERDFVAYVVEKLSLVASVVAYGAELPTAQVGKFSKINAELFKAGLAFDYPEEKQWAMKKAIKEAAARNLTVQSQVLPNGTILKGANNTLADYLFNTVADMAAALTDLNYLLTAQVAQFGYVNYVDPRTSATLSIDYRDPMATYGYAPNGVFAHFPPDLTGTPQAWDQRTTANGLQNLEADVEQFRETNGFPPSAILMPHKLRLDLRNQENTRRAWSSISNTSAATVVSNAGIISTTMLERLLDDMSLPPIIICDEMYHDIDGSKIRFFNADRYVFLTKGMGEQALGPTLENDGAAGPYVATRQIREFPPQDATQGVATMLPVVPNPKLLFSRRAK